LGITVQAKPPWLRNLRDFRVTISGDFAMVNPPFLTQSADTTFWDVETYQGEDIRFEIPNVGYAVFTETNLDVDISEYYGGELINIYSVGHAIDDLATIDPRDTWIILMSWEHEDKTYHMTISSDWDADGEGVYDPDADTWTMNFDEVLLNTEIMEIKKTETSMAEVCRGKSGICKWEEKTQSVVVWNGLADGFLEINLEVQRLSSN
jgi:hypothetical protein